MNSVHSASNANWNLWKIMVEKRTTREKEWKIAPTPHKLYVYTYKGAKEEKLYKKIYWKDHHNSQWPWNEQRTSKKNIVIYTHSALRRLYRHKTSMKYYRWKFTLKLKYNIILPFQKNEKLIKFMISNPIIMCVCMYGAYVKQNSFGACRTYVWMNRFQIGL